jgi:thymidylate synthase
MIKSNNFQEIERILLSDILTSYDFISGETFEKINVSFCLTDPQNNKNNRSNYRYAEEFFNWMISGDTNLSTKLEELNPFAKRFLDTSDLPENFSSTYGWKIKDQLPHVIRELKRDNETRRAYINILLNDDKIILGAKTTHEYPCTIGIQLLIREKKLIMVVNMRSNNAFTVLPYDVYNFTKLQNYISGQLGIEIGSYYHQVNSLHIFKRDVDKIVTQKLN